MEDEAKRSSPEGTAPAAHELLPLVYAELRRLARARLAKVPPGNTLQPTALVHEVYLRLAQDQAARWSHRGHFFAAAAQAMRQVLVDQARRKSARKHGGGQQRVEAEEWELVLAPPPDEVLDLDRALQRLETEDPRKARIVELRYFVGLSREETAEALGVSLRTVDREWRYIVARLHREIAGFRPLPESDPSPPSP